MLYLYRGHKFCLKCQNSGKIIYSIKNGGGVKIAKTRVDMLDCGGIGWCRNSIGWCRSGTGWCISGTGWCGNGIRWCRSGIGWCRSSIGW